MRGFFLPALQRRCGIISRAVRSLCRGSADHVDSRCAQSPHSLPLRPRGTLECAAGSPAAGAALPHAHPVVFAAGRARQALHQLAAGSAGQLSRTPGIPGAYARVAYRGGSDRRDGGAQPVRFLPRARTPSRCRSSTSAPKQSSWPHTWCSCPPRRYSRSIWRASRVRGPARSIFWWRSISGSPATSAT